MNTIKRGDVFFCLGSPEAVGSEERKTRPVVIIQNDAGNASSPTVIVANMTTNTTRRLYPTQFDIDLPGRALSRVQCEQIRTVGKSRLREKVYTLTEEELRKLDACLAVSFGITHQTEQEGRQDTQSDGDDHIPCPGPEGPVSGRLSPSCAEPGEYHRHRREERRDNPQRRGGRRRNN